MMNKELYKFHMCSMILVIKYALFYRTYHQSLESEGLKL